MSGVFSPTLLSALVYAALGASGLGVTVLIVLLVRDLKNGNPW
ncbi:hypothetical protein ENSA5_37680 [Enhygromyxa salina]|uniref:Uncharacterized protein n=1 Tax=Enhygromyxa salina TaxID=215803 RepID=A0A2S9XRZ7_9BACT|nr:hypothetical protein [Enhygromyxa salina]PRP95635.1 hypothetical protein ENSA5_37680 [Enhygromyxa salina]